MDDLISAIYQTPIIDHHAHNLLRPADIEAHPSLSITTEANGAALEQTTSTLSHLRAVRQLAAILGCDESWDSVNAKLKTERYRDDLSWEKYCFQGIETALIDDGLDAETVQPIIWHDCLTRSACKRIVRIEKVAENMLTFLLAQYPDACKNVNAVTARQFTDEFLQLFRKAIQTCFENEDIAGFKSVVCYRTGLAVPVRVGLENVIIDMMSILADAKPKERAQRLAEECLNPYLINFTAEMITQNTCKKPFQFHTGLGDNDIRLPYSSPSHLQPFIEQYSSVPIVLLHASYPFTKEAAYLASVYRNVYLDIGEVFPMVSQEGQEKVIREALELCPSEKLNWSTE